MHDDYVDRTTNGSPRTLDDLAARDAPSALSLIQWLCSHGLLCEKTLDEVKTLDAGSWFGVDYSNERIPMLIEVSDRVWFSRVRP